MRYSEIDLQCEDITWFGVDANNHVIAFASGGMGNIPEFVCRSKEETKDKVLSLAKSHNGFLENFCVYVKDVLSEKDHSLDDDVIKRIACIVLSTYGFYF